MNFTPYITYAIIALTCLVSYQAQNNSAIYGKLLFYPYRMQREGDYSGFITHGFIHSRDTWMHLLFNMYTLYMFGQNIEYTFQAVFPMMGKFLYICLYLSAIPVASIYSYYQHKDNAMYSAVGASGAVSAIIFSYIFFYPKAMLMLFFVPMPAYVFGIAYLVYSSYMGKQGRDNVGHDAHFYGAVYGFLFTIIAAAIFRPDLIQAFIQQLTTGGLW